jgi:hypothetical protein
LIRFVLLLSYAPLVTCPKLLDVLPAPQQHFPIPIKLDPTSSVRLPILSTFNRLHSYNNRTSINGGSTILSPWYVCGE